MTDLTAADFDRMQRDHEMMIAAAPPTLPAADLERLKRDHDMLQELAAPTRPLFEEALKRARAL